MYNKIAYAIRVTTVLIFPIFFVVGIAIGNKYSNPNYSIMASVWVSGCLCGMFFLGISEIIEVLERIARKNYEVNNYNNLEKQSYSGNKNDNEEG